MQMLAVTTPENAATLYDEVSRLPGTPTSAQLLQVSSSGHCCPPTCLLDGIPAGPRLLLHLSAVDCVMPLLPRLASC